MCQISVSENIYLVFYTSIIHVHAEKKIDSVHKTLVVFNCWVELDYMI